MPARDWRDLILLVAVIVAAVPLPGLAANIGFVHFDKTGQQRAVIRHRLADPVHHRPHSRAAHVEIACRLHGTEALSGTQHQGNQQEPALKIDVRAVKNGPDRHAERAQATLTLPTRRREAALGVAVARDALGSAVGAKRPIRPTPASRWTMQASWSGQRR